jgi:hypothetical protein
MIRISPNGGAPDATPPGLYVLVRTRSELKWSVNLPLMASHSIPKEGQLLLRPLFNEPMLVETVRSGGAAVWTIGLVRGGSDASGVHLTN